MVFEGAEYTSLLEDLDTFKQDVVRAYASGVEDLEEDQIQIEVSPGRPGWGEAC